MNNNQLTYLRALGITPWQRNATFKLNPDNNHAKCLIVIDGQAQSGQSDTLLNNMLRAIGIDQSQVSIMTMTTLSALEKHIALTQPSLLLTLGQTVAQSVLNSTMSLNELRQHTHTIGEAHTRVIVTFHPLDLLHQPSDKRLAFRDLQGAKRALDNSQ